jgi:hypothetical protein
MEHGGEYPVTTPQRLSNRADSSVGYDRRQLADPRDEVDAIGTKGRRSVIASFKTPFALRAG